MTAKISRPLPGAADANRDADNNTISVCTDNIERVEAVPCPMSSTLLPQHRRLLEASGIPLDFAFDNGVRSVSGPLDLPDCLQMHSDSLPGMLFQWTSPDGTCNYQLRPDSPTVTDGKPAKYLQAIGVHLLNILGDPSSATEAWFVEGTRQGMAARACAPDNVLIVGIPGCHNAMKDGLLLPGLADLIEGLPVVLFFDADLRTNDGVRLAAKRLGEVLDLEGAESVSFALVPGEGNAGLDDLLGQRAIDKRSKFVTRLAAKATKALPSASPKPAADKMGRPSLNVTADRLCLINDIVTVMTDRWDGWRLFNHGDVVSELEDSRMVALDRGRLLGVLAETAYFYRPSSTGAKAAWPDANTVVAVAAKAACFTPLDRLSRAPFVREDGTICQTAGYDAASRTYLLSDESLGPITVPDSPSDEQVTEAVQYLLDEWLGDMPLHEQADRANLLALILTPFVRGLIPLVPLAVVDGLMMGVGKNLLADCIALVTTGVNADPLPYPDDDDEQRKVITSTFGTGAELFVFDEAHYLHGKSLARALTATSYTDRILGVSRMARYPNTVTWVALGNQVKVGGDLARRVYRIALRPNDPDPERRETDQFHHPDLRTWTRENRAELIQAALTLVRAWYAVGQPAAPTACSFGSFEVWERILGGILHHAGVPGFLANLGSWRTEADFDTGYWQDHLRDVVLQFPDKERFTVGEVVDLMEGGFITEMPPDLLEYGARGYPRALGQAYSKVKDRWFGAYRIVVGGVPGQGGAHGRVNTWRIEQRGEGGLEEVDLNAAAEGTEGTGGPGGSLNWAAGLKSDSMEGSEGREGSHNPSHKQPATPSESQCTSVGRPQVADLRRAVPSDPFHPSAVYRHLAAPITVSIGTGQEQQITRIARDLSNRGLLVDTGLLEARLGEQRVRQVSTRKRLVEELALNGHAANSPQPWITRQGRWAFSSFAGPDWPRRDDRSPVIDLDSLSQPLASARGRRFTSVCSAIHELIEDGPWLGSLDENLAGERVHPEYRMDTVTGRWTSRSPNVLGAGRRNAKLLADRDLILAEPGEVLIAADLSGIDARCVAGLSGDVEYAALFQPGRDIHLEMSLLFFGDTKHREQAKTITHGLNYGRGAASVADQIGVPVTDVEQMIDRCFAQFPEVAAWQTDLRTQAADSQRLPTGTGRQILGDPDRAHTTAPAWVAQACARDLAMVGLLRLVDEG